MAKEKRVALFAGVPLSAFCARVCIIPGVVLFFPHF